MTSKELENLTQEEKDALLRKMVKEQENDPLIGTLQTDEGQVRVEFSEFELTRGPRKGELGHLVRLSGLTRQPCTMRAEYFAAVMEFQDEIAERFERAGKIVRD